MPIQFAEAACGNVTVLLNGSVAEAFSRNRYSSAGEAALPAENPRCFFVPGSMFGSVELESLDPGRVNYVNIKVVSCQQGPLR